MNAWFKRSARVGVALAATAVASLFSLTVQAQASAPAATVVPPNGRVLAANCANCHGTTGQAKGAIPSLAGQKREYLIEQMKLFKQDKRQATIMHQLAKGYTDQEIEAMADFFSKQKPN